jgi:hypothetical protein
MGNDGQSCSAAESEIFDFERSEAVCTGPAEARDPIEEIGRRQELRPPKADLKVACGLVGRKQVEWDAKL